MARATEGWMVVLGGDSDTEGPLTTGATRGHKCKRDQENRHGGREREASEVRRSKLPWHRGDFQTTTQTFLTFEKSSQQAPSRFQIPKHVGGANAGETGTCRGRDAHTGTENRTAGNRAAVRLSKPHTGSHGEKAFPLYRLAAPQGPERPWLWPSVTTCSQKIMTQG